MASKSVLDMRSNYSHRQTYWRESTTRKRLTLMTLLSVKTCLSMPGEALALSAQETASYHNFVSFVVCSKIMMLLHNRRRLRKAVFCRERRNTMRRLMPIFRMLHQLTSGCFTEDQLSFERTRSAAYAWPCSLGKETL